MRSRRCWWSVVVVAFACCGGPGAATVESTPPAAESPPVDADPVTWLRANAVPLRSIDPDDGDFSDLEPLRAIVGDARVVLLGEQSHADGATFLAKARLIRFLHEQLDFTVLVFESGMFECHEANRALAAGDEPMTAIRESIYPIWSELEQTRPLWRLVIERARAEPGLELAGVDIQNGMPLATDRLLPALETYLRGASPPLLDDVAWTAARDAVTRLLTEPRSIDPEALTTLEPALIALRNAAGSAAALDRHPAADVSFWVRVTTGLLEQARSLGYPKLPNGTRDRHNNHRDRAMGDNLVWLAQERYPDRKIIVWAATFHIVRDVSAIDMVDEPDYYEGVVTMGEVAHATLGDAALYVGFLAIEGAAGNPMFGDETWPLDPPAPGSFEDVADRAGLDNAVVDLRAAPWLAEPMLARPLGYADTRAVWPAQLDVMVVTRTMFPGTKAQDL